MIPSLSLISVPYVSRLKAHLKPHFQMNSSTWNFIIIPDDRIATYNFLPILQNGNHIRILHWMLSINGEQCLRELHGKYNRTQTRE